MLVLTVCVASCLGFYRLFPVTALLLIWPVVVVPLLIFIRRTRLMLWLPVSTMFWSIVLMYLAQPNFDGAAFWSVIIATCSVAIVENTIRKTRVKFAANNSNDHLQIAVLGDSCIAGALIGLTFGSLWFVIGIVFLPLDFVSGMIVIAYSLAGCALFPLLGGLFGWLIGVVLIIGCSSQTVRGYLLPEASHNEASNE